MRGKALVAGALGIVGGHVADHLHACGWEVIGVSRSEPRTAPPWRLVQLDLADGDACAARVAAEAGITHLFYAARAPIPDPSIEARTNLRMLANLLEPLARNETFAHACVVHGSKWYGSHLGAFRTPAHEDDPPHLGPNFYIDQLELLAGRQRGARWSWSTLRPGVVCGYALGYPHNLIAVIAAYAAVSKALGLPLRFPGTQACFDAISQVTDAGLLARAAHWIASDPGCANQSFNLTNGDAFRWRHLWPRLARHLGMEDGGVQTVPLGVLMADKEPLWRELVARHGLRPLALAEVANWAYADMTFRQDWDHLSSTLKARRFGFQDFVETEPMFFAHLDRYRTQRIVP